MNHQIPVFESNEDRTYFVVRLRLHPKTIQTKTTKITTREEHSENKFLVGSTEYKILEILQIEPLSKKELAIKLGQTNVTGQLSRIINSLLHKRLLERTIPNKPQSRLQQYKITKKGKKTIDHGDR